MAKIKGKGNDEFVHMEHALDRLVQAKLVDLPGMLAGTTPKTPHVHKLKLGGKLRQRPMWCRGPLPSELTFLFPAYERNGAFVPPDAPNQAEKRRKEIVDDSTRRRFYEHVPSHP
jgi:hypothetical protein